MAVLVIENTGLDHLYPDGVPVIETSVAISDILAEVARMSSLTVQADPYFTDKSKAQKVFSELHGEGDRITMDFLKRGANEILPVFASRQRWLTDESGIERFEFDVGGLITYRWLNLDTRPEDYKLNYTSATLEDLRIDTNVLEKIENYLFEALKDYVLRELYKVIGYEKRYMDQARIYEQNRQYVAYWIKKDTSLQTQYPYGGV